MSNGYRPSAGVSPETSDTPSSFLKSDHTIEVPITISSAARDSGNTPTTTLRPGLVLGRLNSSGKFKEYNNSRGDGTETAVCILRHQVKVVDSDGNACDAQAVGVIHGYVDASKLIGLDANARTDLDNILFDDEILKTS